MLWRLSLLAKINKEKKKRRKKKKKEI